jgi:uncharacterized membrane protein
MKTRSYSSILVTTLLALAIPASILAEEQYQSAGETNHGVAAAKHHHYKLIDIGTFGGPNSSVNENAEVISKHETVVGGADTSTPDPNFPSICLFCGSSPNPFITHAFQWQDGAQTDLGALPGITSSFAQWTSKSGLSVGYSENGSIDPLLGIPEIRAVLWKDGQVVDLGTLGGGYESGAFAVNSKGQVAGVSLNLVPDSFDNIGGVTQQRTFLWENGLMRDLGAGRP